MLIHAPLALGTSSELAWAHGNLASRRMELSEAAEAIALARQARSLAELMGLPDVRSDALNTEGCAMAEVGGDWQDLLDRALDIAISQGLQEQAGRAYANLYALFAGSLRFAEREEYFVDGVATATSTTSALSERACAASGPEAGRNWGAGTRRRPCAAGCWSRWHRSSTGSTPWSPWGRFGRGGTPRMSGSVWTRQRPQRT